MALGTPTVPTNGSGTSTTPTDPQSTGSITLQASVPGLILVNASRNPATTTTVTTTGLTVGTITSIGTVTYGTIASAARRLSAWWYPGSSSPGTGTFNFDFGAALNGLAYTIVEWPGMDTVAPIVNALTARADSSAAPLVTLSDGTWDATVGIFANGDSTLALTLGSGFGALAANQTVASSNSFRMRSEYVASKDLTVDMSQSAAHWGGIAFGVLAATESGGFTINGSRTSVGGRWRRPAALMGG